MKTMQDEPGKATFGLTSGTATRGGPRLIDRGDVSDDGLLDSLYDRYRLVLADPQASLDDGQGDRTTGSQWLPWTPPVESPPQADSVDIHMRGPRVVEDAFGRLVDDSAFDPAVSASAPEILGLFASPACREEALRRSPAVPPALARRDHQTAGIDSPLPPPFPAPSHANSRMSDASA